MALPLHVMEVGRGRSGDISYYFCFQCVSRVLVKMMRRFGQNCITSKIQRANVTFARDLMTDVQCVMCKLREEHRSAKTYPAEENTKN